MITLKDLLKDKDVRRMSGVNAKDLKKMTQNLKGPWKALQKRKLILWRLYEIDGLEEYLLLTYN